MGESFGQEGVAAFPEMGDFGFGFEPDFSGHDVQKALPRCRPQFAIRLRLSRISGEASPYGRPRVYDGHASLHTRQGSAHEGIGSQQQMIQLPPAASVAKFTHARSRFAAATATEPTLRADTIPPQVPSQRPRVAPSLLGCGWCRRGFARKSCPKE